MKKTPIYDLHLALGGKIIDFGGWALPVEYSGIIEEHKAVRSAAGLFDVSHMGEITVSGSQAEEFLQKMLTNDIHAMQDYQIYYTLMCYPDGGVVDDLIVYKYNQENYLLVVNAANIQKDYEWLQKHSLEGAEIKNVSDHYAQFALQGPNAQAILQEMADMDLSELGFFRFRPDLEIGGFSALVSRSGYTGEDGFEIYVRPADAALLWQKLLEKGKSHGLVPVGLGARDTLRFEAVLPLYGHEIAKNITPLEAGLSFFVKFNKEDFIGKDVLVKQKETGIPRKLAAFEMLERGIPRSAYEVQAEGKQIGYVTTGGFSPSLNKNIGLALIEAEYAQEDKIIEVIVRNKKLQAVIIAKPFYKKKYKKNQQ